jgi:hypothetical protein
MLLFKNKIYAADVNKSRVPEKGAHSPSWQNGLIIIISILFVSGVPPVRNEHISVTVPD